MTCATAYCWQLDGLVLLAGALLYAAGVGAWVWFINRKYQREVDEHLRDRLKPYTRY